MVLEMRRAILKKKFTCAFRGVSKYKNSNILDILEMCRIYIQKIKVN